ncbi:MAG TPA: heparinase II/III family protein [Gaiellaceae bacterium]
MTALVVGGIAFVFVAKMVNYVDPPLSTPAGILSLYHAVRGKMDEVIRNASFLHSCPAQTQKIGVPGGWQCAPTSPTAGPYERAFRSYPAEPHGREFVYASTAGGSASAGQALLHGIVDVPRYEPVRIGTRPSWREDPYGSVYWRFNYYALRPSENLLSAYLTSGDARYSRALVSLDESFFRAESSSPFAWSDFHAVAFRSMVLVHEWWILREYHQLRESDSNQFLRELEKTGEFLADRNHYQPQYNHGVNESVALLELALDFPSLPHARSWRAVAQSRIRHGLTDLIDADGSLVENSPYYHFYTLDKLWQLFKFTDRIGFTVAADFRPKLLQMTAFATYILHPDASVPLLGASIAATIHDSGSFAELAKVDPSFEYVLTEGKKGKRPSKTSVFFPHAGLTILRSGWGKGSTFRSQSYLTFNVGAYRTAHSQLDGLGITLFGEQRTLLPSPGLYTYAVGKHPGPMFRYFHGTLSHNTVAVDNRDQLEGSVTAGPLRQGAGVTYQSAESSLYPGVTHRRMVMMLDRSHFLLVDRLSSRAVHTYRQVFHFFSGATVTLHHSTATGVGRNPDQRLAVRQLGPVARSELVHAQLRPPAALCSARYHHAKECVAATYTQRGVDAAFTTLLTIGRPDPRFHASFDRRDDVIQVADGDRHLAIRLGETTAIAPSAHAAPPPAPVPSVGEALAGTASRTDWSLQGHAVSLPVPEGAVAAARTAGGEPALLGDDGVRADLSHANLQIRIKINGEERLSDLYLELSNRNWSSYASNDIRNAYPSRYDGEWLTISLARSKLRDDVGGRWTTHGSGFDWSQIDGVRVRFEGEPGAAPATIALAFVKAIPEQKEGAAVLVFDDGYDSILPAAAYLHKNGMPGNVAVIGKYTTFSRIHHLTKYDLRRLQDRWGWNMANHTQNHVDAVAAYSRRGGSAAYERDILQGAQVLQQTGLDSAPDWLIYPHGTVDASLERVVRRFYRFARTTDEEPEAYPFGDPLRVKTLEVSGASDSEGGSSADVTTPEQVIRAAKDAVAFHSTLILTFHRIHGRASDPPGYPLASFEKIVDGLKQTRIRVVTLSGLERLMGVATRDRITVDPGRPSQITARLTERTIHHKGGGLLHWFAKHL